MKQFLPLLFLFIFFSCENEENEATFKQTVSTYPNPCDNFVRVTGNLRTQNVLKIKIANTDIENVVVPNKFGVFDAPLNVKDLKPGSYQIQLFDEDKEVYRSIIIKQKVD